MTDPQTKQNKMLEALEWCYDNNKTIEFSIEYIANQAKCTHDEALNFIMDNPL